MSYVLHSHDWSETSLIVELFTRAQGRVVVAAKGAKRPTSQLRSVLMPFQPLFAVLGKTPADDQGEIHNLRGAEWAGGRPLLGGSALFPAFYINELLIKLLARQDPHPVLFDAYADTLSALALRAPGADDESATLRAFELVLLRELGWLPELDTATLTAEPLQPLARYTLRPEAGLIASEGAPRGSLTRHATGTPPAAGVAGAAWVGIEAALAHGSLTALRLACAPVVQGLRTPLREVLAYHLGPSPLRTRDVLQGLQRL